LGRTTAAAAIITLTYISHISELFFLFYLKEKIV
jgi:hypothetical protein